MYIAFTVHELYCSSMAFYASPCTSMQIPEYMDVVTIGLCDMVTWHQVVLDDIKTTAYVIAIPFCNGTIYNSIKLHWTTPLIFMCYNKLILRM